MTIEALCKPFYSINNGPKIDPWGTAQVIYEYEFLFLFCTMFCFLWARWLSSHNKLLPLTLYASSFSVKILVSIVSNVFERWNTLIKYLLPIKPFAILSTSSITAWSVEWPVQKPNWGKKCIMSDIYFQTYV